MLVKGGDLCCGCCHGEFSSELRARYSRSWWRYAPELLVMAAVAVTAVMAAVAYWAMVEASSSQRDD